MQIGKLLKTMTALEEAVIIPLCERFGYGRVMQIASDAWQAKEKAEGRSGGIVTGPHASGTVPCVCQRPEFDQFLIGRPHCDFCCGCHWLTEAVFTLVCKAIEHGELTLDGRLRSTDK